jgi:hypothetical protein
MPKQDSFDYRKAMEDYDKSIGKEDTDLPLKYTTTSDGGVDYLAASKAYEKQLVEDGFIVSPKKTKK